MPEVTESLSEESESQIRRAELIQGHQRPGQSLRILPRQLFLWGTRSPQRGEDRADGIRAEDEAAESLANLDETWTGRVHRTGRCPKHQSGSDRAWGKWEGLRNACSEGPEPPMNLLYLLNFSIGTALEVLLLC